MKRKKMKIKNINNKVDCHRLIDQAITLDNLHSIKKSFYEKTNEYLTENGYIFYCIRFRGVLIIYFHYFFL